MEHQYHYSLRNNPEERSSYHHRYYESVLQIIGFFPRDAVLKWGKNLRMDLKESGVNEVAWGQRMA
jgi:hypothetical protein